MALENDFGGSPLDFLVWVVRHQYKPGLDYAGAARLLVEAGADVGAVDGLPTGAPRWIESSAGRKVLRRALR